MLLSEVYSTLADTYETIDFRMVLVENAETHEQDLVFLKTVWCMDSEIKEDKKWDFYHKLNEDSRLQFVHKLIEKKNIQKFFDDLTNGIIQIDDSLIELSDMEKLYLSSDFKINQLYAYLPELYPKDVEYPSLLMRPNYDNNCSSILNSNGISLQMNGIETLKIVESFLDVKGTILINSRIVAMLPIYCKLYDYNGPTIEFNDKLVDRLNLLVMNDEIKSIPFGSISYTSNKGMNKFGLKRYFEHGNEKINILFDPLELIIINHENESLIELQNLNILGTDSETNEKLISFAENQRLEK